MAVEKITLNLIPTGETPTIHAAQFDKERSFQIELKEGEDDFSPTGYDIELQVRKVDNNIVTAVPSQTSGNIVTFLTTEQMTACSGTNLAELQISKNNMSIATLHFYLVVQRDVLVGGLSSQSEIYDLEEQIAAIVPEVIGDEYYTADQVDEKIAEIPTFDPTNYYDKTQLYTKTETNGLLSQKANTSSLSTVAFTGSYDDLVDHPVIPDVSNYYTKGETYSQAEVNTLLSTKADTSSLSSVATSGSYDDLTDKPTIPGNATELPITSGSAVNTKEYIDDKTTLVKSASGDLITITDGGDNIPLKSCEVTINPDLTGKTECNLVICGKNLLPSYNLSGSGTLTINSNNGTVYNIPFGQTVYGGSGNALTGEFVSEWGKYTITNDTILTNYNTSVAYGSWAMVSQIGVQKIDNTNIMVFCDVAKGVSFDQRIETANQRRVYTDQTGQVVIRAAATDNITSLEDLKNLFMGANICYTLATPTSLTLSGVTPKTLSGINNIYNDCGNTAIEYFTSSADGLAALIEVLSK